MTIVTSRACAPLSQTSEESASQPAMCAVRHQAVAVGVCRWCLVFGVLVLVGGCCSWCCRWRWCCARGGIGSSHARVRVAVPVPARRHPVSQPPSIRPAAGGVAPTFCLSLHQQHIRLLHSHESEYSTPPNQPPYQRPIDRSKAAFHPPAVRRPSRRAQRRRPTDRQNQPANRCTHARTCSCTCLPA